MEAALEDAFFTDAVFVEADFTEALFFAGDELSSWRSAASKITVG
ncbi:hypothetical protein [Treponema sp.]|nr:hypothetical protein [Treponema sp.]